MIIDHSANQAYDYCPGKWYEQYINLRQKKWPNRLRDDALALGSLVHGGLEVWQRDHRIEIPQEIVEEVTPSRECLSLASELVLGYARTYPEEMWPLVMCEEPVTWPLQTEDKWIGYDDVVHIDHELTGLAKIDSYFYVPTPQTIESGIPGITYTLNPGWWIHEYKTKSPYIDMGLYMQGWEMNMQASYQITALSHHLRVDWCDGMWPGELIGAPVDATVQGVLVNVLEKPKRYIPKRKCRPCGESYEFATWIPTGTGMYACPVCGNQQVLKPLQVDTPQTPPSYYRIVVTRTADQLARDREIMLQVGQDMIEMESGGLNAKPWKKGNCVNFQWKRACEYQPNHLHGVSTLEDDGFYTPEKDYRGLTQIEL